VEIVKQTRQAGRGRRFSPPFREDRLHGLRRKLRNEGIIDVPLCATNRFNAPRVGERILQENDADLVSMARPFLADPDIVKKSREGRVEEINTCIACNQACLDHAFVG